EQTTSGRGDHRQTSSPPPGGPDAKPGIPCRPSLPRPVGRVHEVFSHEQVPCAGIPGVRGANQRRLAFIFSNTPLPGHSSFSESLLNGAATVLRWAWRSSGLGSRYSNPVTTSPFAAWCATYSSALTRSVGS